MKTKQWSKEIDAVSDILYHSGVLKEEVNALAFRVVQEVLYIHCPEEFRPTEETLDTEPEEEYIPDIY